ncbi:unnamed protein product [Heterobilharzia americana]|nr:unnamed protein product [Heterobilharzia americana]
MQFCFRYRKRCRALGIPDRIGQSLNLGPPSPTVEGSDETVKEFPVSPKRSGTELENEVVDKDGGIWFPVRTPYICDLFTEKPADAYHASVANFIRAQSVISQRLGLEGQNDEISSLDTTSSVQTHSEVASVHSEDAKAEESLEPSEQPSELDNSLSTTEIQTNPSKCLEIQAEPVTPSSLAIVTDSETLTSPHFTQSLNSSPALSNVAIHSPSSQNANRSRKRANAKRKAPSTAPTTPPSTTTVTAPVVNQSQESESTSALSPTLSTNPNNEEPVEVFQSSINIARGWRRSLLSVLSTVYSHRHAYVFMNPVTEDIAPGYGTVVHEPVDLTSLRRRMESSLSHLISSQQPSAVNPSVSSYQVIVEVATRFIRDLLLMFANARMYNSQNHEVHRMAGKCIVM